MRELAVRGHPVAELTETAREALLLVVGHRGLGGFPGLLTGSVAMGVLHHATCPVAVVRDERSTGRR
ncbi:universal stress protein [Saccharopolyspora spinosporotrichia]